MARSEDSTSERYSLSSSWKNRKKDNKVNAKTSHSTTSFSSKQNTKHSRKVKNKSDESRPSRRSIDLSKMIRGGGGLSSLGVKSRQFTPKSGSFSKVFGRQSAFSSTTGSQSSSATSAATTKKSRFSKTGFHQSPESNRSVGRNGRSGHKNPGSGNSSQSVLAINIQNEHYENWARTYSRYLNVVHVRCEQDILHAIRYAKAHGVTVRAMGSLYSWPTIAVPSLNESQWKQKQATGNFREPITLNMHQYKKIISIDLDMKTVEVEAGCTLHEFNQHLSSHGLALACMGNVDGQTLSGVISTGTHGKNPMLGSMSSLLQGMKFIDGHGNVISLTRDHPLFPVVGVSIGMLGVISTLTFNVVNAYDMEYFIEDFRFEVGLSLLDTVIESNYEAISYIYFPLIDRFRVELGNRVEDRPRLIGEPQRTNYHPPPTFPKYLVSILHYFLVFLSIVTFVFGCLCRPLLRVVALLTFTHGKPKSPYFAPSYQVVANNSSLDIKHYEMEFAFDRRDIKEILRAIREVFKHEALSPSDLVDIRFTAADPFWLSPAYGRDTVWVDFIVFRYGIQRYKRLYTAVLQIAKKFRGRPHWGKVNLLGSKFTSGCFPESHQFELVRRQLDPHHVFHNKYLNQFCEATSLRMGSERAQTINDPGVQACLTQILTAAAGSSRTTAVVAAVPPSSIPPPSNPTATTVIAASTSNMHPCSLPSPLHDTKRVVHSRSQQYHSVSPPQRHHHRSSYPANMKGSQSEHKQHYTKRYNNTSELLSSQHYILPTRQEYHTYHTSQRNHHASPTTQSSSSPKMRSSSTVSEEQQRYHHHQHKRSSNSRSGGSNRHKSRVQSERGDEKHHQVVRRQLRYEEEEGEDKSSGSTSMQVAYPSYNSSSMHDKYEDISARYTPRRSRSTLGTRRPPPLYYSSSSQPREAPPGYPTREANVYPTQGDNGSTSLFTSKFSRSLSPISHYKTSSSRCVHPSYLHYHDQYNQHGQFGIVPIQSSASSSYKMNGESHIIHRTTSSDHEIRAKAKELQRLIQRREQDLAQEQEWHHQYRHQDQQQYRKANANLSTSPRKRNNERSAIQGRSSSSRYVSTEPSRRSSTVALKTRNEKEILQADRARLLERRQKRRRDSVNTTTTSFEGSDTTSQVSSSVSSISQQRQIVESNHHHHSSSSTKKKESTERENSGKYHHSTSTTKQDTAHPTKRTASSSYHTTSHRDKKKHRKSSTTNSSTSRSGRSRTRK